MKNEKKKAPIYYGGQALMEGVMMRGASGYAIAVRKPDGDIHLSEKPLSNLSERFPIFKWPILRGVIAFGSAMVIGFSAITHSAEIALQEEGSQDTDSDSKWNDISMGISVVLAIVIALGLFMLLPAFIGSLFANVINVRWTGVVEGLVRILIFVAYVFLISWLKDVQRVFQYHGAEHKAINCHENNMPLTPENIKNFSRFHKRCGTSFLLIVMVVSMILFMFIQTNSIWMRFGSRILLLPIIAGISYEITVKWAGRRDNWLVRALIFPGMCLQRLTTAEPDEGQIEVAVMALNKALEQDANKVAILNKEPEQEVLEL